MKTVQDFRELLRSYLGTRTGKYRGRQKKLALASGVPQYIISRFLSGTDVRGGHLMPLQAALAKELLPILCSGDPQAQQAASASPESPHAKAEESAHE